LIALPLLFLVAACGVLQAAKQANDATSRNRVILNELSRGDIASVMAQTASEEKTSQTEAALRAAMKLIPPGTPTCTLTLNDSFRVYQGETIVDVSKSYYYAAAKKIMLQTKFRYRDHAAPELLALELTPAS
jgi:hypothetical protein